MKSVKRSSGLVNRRFLTYIPPSFNRILRTRSLRHLSEQRLTLYPSYIFRLDTFLQSFSYTRREQTSSHKPDIRKVYANEAYYFGWTLSTSATHSTLLGWASKYHWRQECFKSSVAFKATYTFVLRVSILTSALNRRKRSKRYRPVCLGFKIHKLNWFQ